jgi:hypothetical protein
MPPDDITNVIPNATTRIGYPCKSKFLNVPNRKKFGVINAFRIMRMTKKDSAPYFEKYSCKLYLSGIIPDAM